MLVNLGQRMVFLMRTGFGKLVRNWSVSEESVPVKYALAQLVKSAVIRQLSFALAKLRTAHSMATYR